jgi:hypothetical protein
MKREKGLKKEYRTREIIWNCGFGWILKKIFTIAWKHAALIAYPLAIEFAFGAMKHHYLKYGAESVWERLSKYNLVLAARMRGEDNESYNDLFTKERQEEWQLEAEMNELMNED